MDAQIQIISLVDAIGQMVTAKGKRGKLVADQKHPGMYSMVNVADMPVYGFNETNLRQISRVYGEIVITIA